MTFNRTRFSLIALCLGFASACGPQDPAAEGVIGDIADTTEYEDFAYDFGLFVYNFAHPDGITYQVVNYWTANLAPGYHSAP